MRVSRLVHEPERFVEFHGSSLLRRCSFGLRESYSGQVGGCIERDSPEHARALGRGPLIFCTLQPETLYPEHSKIEIYTWGAKSYTLPAGATEAALVGHLANLKSGDV